MCREKNTGQQSHSLSSPGIAQDLRQRPEASREAEAHWLSEAPGGTTSPYLRLPVPGTEGVLMPSSRISSHGRGAWAPGRGIRPCLCLRLFSASGTDTGHWGRGGPTQPSLASFYLITSAKGLLPEMVTFTGTGVRTSTFVWEGTGVNWEQQPSPNQRLSHGGGRVTSQWQAWLRKHVGDKAAPQGTGAVVADIREGQMIQHR